MKIIHFILLFSACTSKLVQAEEKDLIQPLLDWLVEHGGYFNEKLEIRRADPDDPTSRFGMFSNADITNDDLLIEIPRKVLVNGEGVEGEFGDHGISCETTYNLIKELKLGDKSFYAPYVNYLLTQEEGQLPSHWSDEGKALFLELLAQDDMHSNDDLRPMGAVGWIDHEWHVDCHGGDDRFEQHVALMVLQRGWDDILIPVYDMMSHRNGKWLNTKCNSVHKKDSIKVRASRDIVAGEEMYTSYNFCTDCGNRVKMGYGAPEILRDFGFVEMYPQRWHFGRRISFELDEDDNGEVQVKWRGKKPNTYAKRWMLDQVERLTNFDGIDLAYHAGTIPKNELDTMAQYQKAVANAFTLALRYLNVTVETPADCDSDSAACGLSARYDDLSWKPDLTDYNVDTCNTDVSMSFKGFERIENFRSPYHKIEFFKHYENDDVCFEISDIVQMCGSYRPHYHEMVVHYTARYLDEVKRVLWVGGGDSMLLHEILKYPSLEFVVGLEIDQTVTRMSFKHFGTQPHFDNDKVQWWYGDAAKSLLMLPEDYFGSFDLVLVDLSETVMSFSVTEGLDIFQALALLLKPDGIIVKNEHKYVDQFANIFDYTIQIHYSPVPVICSQCLIFGSNKIDFLNRELKDHGIPSDYMPEVAEIKDPLEFYHDYRHNSSSIGQCNVGGVAKAVPEVQTQSPGILMIVEAEDTLLNLEDPEKVLDILVAALTDVGFTKKSSTSLQLGDQSILSIILAEGYVTARAFPAAKYCAIDLHLWGSFDRQEIAKKALLHALGSRENSSYRIVAGGMFGLSQWKDDEKKRGPRVTESCEREEVPIKTEVMEKSVADTVLVETLKLTEGAKDMKIAVLCGEKDSPCQFLDVLKNGGFTEVVPIHTCPGTTNEFEEGAVERMIECEKELYNMLLASAAEKRIRAIVFDPSATYAISRLAYKIFKGKKSDLFNHELFVLSIKFTEEEAWRINLVERFRKSVIVYEPNFKAVVAFNGTDSDVEVGITSSGDWEFCQRLKKIVATIAKETNLVGDILDITGGLYTYDADWKPDHFFLPEDFEQRTPLVQYLSQEPVGYQTMFQMESEEDLSITIETMVMALRGTLVSLKPDKIQMHQETTVGDGLITVGMWSGGSIVILWDGRKHVDVNLFTFVESKKLAKDTFAKVTEALPKTLGPTLKDIQPRGYGRVVNFKKDIEPRSIPHWAKFKESN